jgi:4-phospho-D-threonate 3-dehydrogenase / 4-phospho-D-erythronate 3-dehydrogenase
MAKPRIGVTVGDPAGIGPEIVEKALADPRVRAACRPTVYGPPGDVQFQPGVFSAETGRAAHDALLQAAYDAMGGAIDAIATAPVSKEAFRAAGLPWRGHTDLLAFVTGASPVAMMFHAPQLRVILLTVHVPLAEVPRLITRETVESIIRLAARELPRFGFKVPRLALTGLNPHAGEHGLMGDEEQAVLVPAVEACRRDSIQIQGPLPADTLFLRAVRGDFDAVVACYHDQGLIPVKLLGFGQAVNVTLGLPIIRTSVDHGTAFDIAGRGMADPGSLVQAILLAARLAANSRGKPVS